MKTNELLQLFIPYRFVDFETIMNAGTSGAESGVIEKETAKIKRLLKSLVNKKYVTKKVLYQRKNRSGTEQRKWAIETYDASKRWAREHGYKIYVLTKAGFEATMLSMNTDFGNEIRSRNSNPKIAWFDNTKRTRNYNYTRQRANIYTYMRMAGVDVPGEKRVRPTSGIIEDDMQVKTVSDVIREAMKSTMRLMPVDTATYFSSHPTLYMKEEIGGNMEKNLGKDNIIALLVTAQELFPIYHTSDYYGTAWVLKNKKETSVSLTNFAYSISLPNASHNRALIFASNIKEFSDLILSAHREPTDTDRPFGPYLTKSVKLEILAKPFDSLLAIPECEATVAHLKYLINGEATPFEDTLSARLEAFNSEAKYFEMPQYISQTKYTPKEECLVLPNDDFERLIFSENVFQYGALLSEDNSLVTPVFDGRDMDLNKISRVFYFYKEGGNIGTLSIGDQKYKNLIIICFPWQIKWYKSIFGEAIFI